MDTSVELAQQRLTDLRNAFVASADDLELWVFGGPYREDFSRLSRTPVVAIKSYVKEEGVRTVIVTGSRDHWQRVEPLMREGADVLKLWCATQWETEAVGAWLRCLAENMDLTERWTWVPDTLALVRLSQIEAFRALPEDNPLHKLIQRIPTDPLWFVKTSLRMASAQVLDKVIASSHPSQGAPTQVQAPDQGTQTVIASSHPSQGAPTQVQAPDQGTQTFVNVLCIYTGKVGPTKIQELQSIVENNNLTVDEKLRQLDQILPIPATASAQTLAHALGVSKTAIVHSSWWRDHRYGQRDEKIEDRRQRLEDRGDEYDSL